MQPIFAIKPGATGDITLKDDDDEERLRAWSTNRGGPYIPTPVIYGDQLYVLQTTACSRPTRSRPASRSTRSASAAPAGRSARHRSRPTARSTARAKTATSSSIKAGPDYQELAKNSMGEVLMATPAISDGLIIFRGLKNVYAIKAQ